MKYEIVFTKDGWAVGLLISKHNNGVPYEIMGRYDLFGKENYYGAVEHGTWYSSGIYITKNEWFNVAKDDVSTDYILRHYHINLKKKHKFYPYIFPCLITDERSHGINDISICDICNRLKKSKIHFIYNKLVDVIASDFETIIDNISRGR